MIEMNEIDNNNNKGTYRMNAKEKRFLRSLEVIKMRKDASAKEVDGNDDDGRIVVKLDNSFQMKQRLSANLKQQQLLWTSDVKEQMIQLLES